jgi:hypothetical protein
LGTKWSGFSYGPPIAFTDLAQVYSLSRFSSGQAYGRTVTSALTPANARLRWYPVIPAATLTQDQLNDPTIVQAYYYAGTQGVQSGVVVADLKVTYRIILRGPVGLVQGASPATVPVLATHLPILDAPSPDVEEEA